MIFHSLVGNCPRAEHPGSPDQSNLNIHSLRILWRQPIWIEIIFIQLASKYVQAPRLSTPTQIRRAHKSVGNREATRDHGILNCKELKIPRGNIAIRCHSPDHSMITVFDKQTEVKD